MGTVAPPIPKIVYFPRIIIITAGSNDKIDFKEDTAGSEITATLTAGEYSPQQLALHIEEKLNDAGASTYTITYNVTGASVNKFTLLSDGAGGAGDFELLWNTGTNSATSVGSSIGFNTAADDTGVLTYTSDNVAPASVTLTFGEDVRRPRLRWRKDETRVISESGNLQTRNRKIQVFFAFRIVYENNTRIENWIDFMEQCAVPGGQFDFFPHNAGSDHYNFTFDARDFSPEEMIRERLFQKFKFGVQCREVLPHEDINTPTGRGLRARKLINREQYLQ